jgi:hypothetical protein
LSGAWDSTNHDEEASEDNFAGEANTLWSD